MADDDKYLAEEPTSSANSTATLIDFFVAGGDPIAPEVELPIERSRVVEERDIGF
ncbi:MAG: hypothetical protein ACQKBV_01125 [Puniceicoccales bacterium]